MHKNTILMIISCANFAHFGPVLNNYDIWGEELDQNVTNDYYTQSERNTKVLNFFPIPVEEECLSNDGRRKGVCMNTYECRIQGGKSHGFCALGFGVCCIFTATCDQDIYNNITYFVNPNFPDLSLGMSSCNLKLKKIDTEISQIRLDFVHFNLGQPNRRTGICEYDVFIMSGGNSKVLTLCGINSGQHVYFDVENIHEAITISVNMSRRAVARFWEVRITQIPFAQKAPDGCLQYHNGESGIIQTMNFADNGRHLANQDYNVCTRQEENMCSIVYEPCDENSFRIGPNQGSAVSGGITQYQVGMNPQNAVRPDDTGQSQNGNLGPVGDQIASEDIVGEIVEGSGGDGLVGESRNMEICDDKIILPCDSEDLIMPGDHIYCNIAHCGNSLCPLGQTPCKIESSAIPFTIGVHFGPSSREAHPDDNLGMCLRYQQLPCGE